MYKLVFVAFTTLWWCSSTYAARTVDNHLNAKDLSRLQQVFAEGLESNDLQSIYYSSFNIELTDVNSKNALCKNLIKTHAESKLKSYEKDLYLIGAHKKLGCTEKLPNELLTSVSNSLKSNIDTSQEIYYRVSTHKLLGLEIDESTKAKIVKALQDSLKKDDSLSGLGYAFSIAPELGQAAAFVAARVEDAIVQADEVDGKMLQFEGGLSITALVINGAVRVTKYFKKPTPINAEQAVKFATYFLSRRSVQTAKGAHVLIEVLKSMSTIEVAPICIQIIGNGQIQGDSPLLNILAVDLLGKAVIPAPQSIFGKIIYKKDNTVLAEKVQFVSKSSDKTAFAADLSTYKPSRGVYAAEIVADGVFKQKLQFKVLGRVKVHSLEIGVAYADNMSTFKKQNLVYPNTLPEAINAEITQKVILKTVLVDEGSKKVITVHQAFIRLYNKEENQEIIFVAEQDANKAYKFDLDVGMRGNDFGYKSGEYELYLIIGDASLSNSFQWHVANVNLNFVREPKETKKHLHRSTLPEIVHQFRAPEKRPPRILSDVFTGLCLTPLVLLFIIWHKLGINVSNFRLTPSTIGFHVGFGGMLVLFGVFWWKLNMFQTLRLLIPIAILTFLCGNRLLRQIYTKRIAKSG